jgi:type II secretory pathway pseudopilin PulG
VRSSFAGRPAAFSLVEAALSLAIVSFAMVAIMGLFPVAMLTARESDSETRATVIARRIFEELQSLPADNTALVRGPSVTNPGWRITGLDLSTPSVHVLTYDEQGEGLTNEVAPGAFPNPISLAGAYFAAEVRIAPDSPSPGISRVQATVEAPSSAPSSRRSRFVFVTLLIQP